VSPETAGAESQADRAGEGSAQGFAAHRLVELGVPTLLMTGSVMGGYAESLFANQWALVLVGVPLLLIIAVFLVVYSYVVWKRDPARATTGR